MPFSNYDELQESIASRMHRNNLDSIIPDFIALAEDDISKLLKVWWQESLETLLTVASVSTVALPARTKSLRWVRLAGASARPLIRIPAAGLYDKYAQATTGTPLHYSTQEDNLEIGPTPSGIFTLEALCQIGAVPLSDGSPVNAILTNYPNVYFFRSLMHGYRHIRHADEEMKAERASLEAIDAANKESIRRASSGTPGPRYSFRRCIP